MICLHSDKVFLVRTNAYQHPNKLLAGSFI